MDKRDLLAVALVGLGGAWTLAPLGSIPPRQSITQGPTAGTLTLPAELRDSLVRLNATLRTPDRQPVPVADDLTVLRRVHLALTGSIPALATVRAFEAMPTPGRIDRQVEALFADRRTSEYLAERLARAFVGVEDGPFLVYRRRRFVAWLAGEIHRNRPYDQVVRSLLTETGLGTDHPATNFVAVTFDIEQDRYDPERLAARAARAFLGVRLDCAQCHDHPFAAWRRTDFQGLAAFFGQVEARASGLVDAMSDAGPENPAAAIVPRVPWRTDLVPEAGTRRERLAGWITDPRNQAFRRATVNRVWAILHGRPLVEPIDDLDGAESIPAALDFLAEDLSEHGFDLHRLIRLIVASDAFRLDSADLDGESPDGRSVDPAAPFAWGRTWPVIRLRPEQLAGSIIQVGSTGPIDGSSHILFRLIAAARVGDFLGAHGDSGADEFAPAGPSTIPQRLLLMNGGLVAEQVQGDLTTAAGRIAQLAPDDARAVEAAFLVVLTRRPTPDETRHFADRLRLDNPTSRAERLGDLFWVLVNSTEFATNH